MVSLEGREVERSRGSSTCCATSEAKGCRTLKSIGLRASRYFRPVEFRQIVGGHCAVRPKRQLQSFTQPGETLRRKFYCRLLDDRRDEGRILRGVSLRRRKRI